MPETRGMPTFGGNFVARWAAMEAGVSRADVDDAIDDDPMPEPPSGQRRSKRTSARVAAVIADVMGEEFDPTLDYSDMDTVRDIVNEDLTDPQSAWDVLDAAINEGRAGYRAAQEAFAESKGFTNKKAADPPSRRPDARHRAYIQKKANRLGVSFDEAAAMTPRRPKVRVKRRPPSERPVHIIPAP